MRIENLTIVVPVHGRQWTLERCLRYLSAFEGPIIVSDSSPEPYKRAKDFPAIDYRHTPGMPYHRKLKEVYASVQTEFMVDIPDDDFVSLTGLAACCDHLRANPDVMVCGGHTIVFKEGANVSLELIHTGATVAAHIAATNTVGKTETIAERMDRLFAKPTEIVHSVMRKAAAMSPHLLVDRSPELRPIRFFARIWLFTAAAMGRVSHLDTILLVRAKEGRLINGMTYPAELEREVGPEQMENRLGPGGGVLTAYLAETAGLPTAQAEAIVQNVLGHIGTPMTAENLQKARAVTAPLVEAAVNRQAQDLGRMIEAIVRYTEPVT